MTRLTLLLLLALGCTTGPDRDSAEWHTVTEKLVIERHIRVNGWCGIAQEYLIVHPPQGDSYEACMDWVIWEMLRTGKEIKGIKVREVAGR